MAKKASDNIKRYVNPDGTVISTVSRKIIEKDGLYFKDLDGSGVLKDYDDWRKSPKERAESYVKVLTEDEKAALIFISDWRMGKYVSARNPGHKPVLDESGVLDDGEFVGKTIFGQQTLPGTTTLIKEWWNRHLILRENPTPSDLADWLNQLQAVAEECERFVPVEVASNSRNENGLAVFGMNDATGVFSTWPGTLGIAAAAKGSGIEVVDGFAETVRKQWEACGLRKGYMYMADVVTDPRWQRTFGTFGEDPELITEIFRRIVPIIQGSEDGVTTSGVAVTTKHFPGGGARENGFDPHYKMGQWNVYQTPGSLEKYHLPAFQVAVDKNTASIMPYYAKPAEAKSAPQEACGEKVEMKPFGFAFNDYFLNLLRGKMGFKGYVNSDTGICHNMCWGVEDLDVPARVALAVNSGVDLISGLFDNADAKEALRRGREGWDGGEVPYGLTEEMVTLSPEALDRAVARTLEEKFALGLFDNPYRDPAEAERTVADKASWDLAAAAHRASVTLLKNKDNTLPLKKGGKVYVEAFAQDPKLGESATKTAREEAAKYAEVVDDPAKADAAILLAFPNSGAYFNATPGYLELEICENKTVRNCDDEGKPASETHEETTLSGLGKLLEAAKTVKANGGKVVSNINITLAWEVGPLEEVSDALLAGYDTYTWATMEAAFGIFAPTGKLPLTLPRNDSVLAVGDDGVCVSPNDVPGYDKDQYMPDSLKDENGRAYAYRDSEGNYYGLGFGLTW